MPRASRTTTASTSAWTGEFDLGAATVTGQVGLINAYDRRNLLAFDVFTLRRTDQLPLFPVFGLKVDLGG